MKGAMSMPARILSYLGSTLLTGGGILVAQGGAPGAAPPDAVVNTGIGVIVMGLATFLAPHVTAWLKDAREERRRGYKRQIEELRDDLDDMRHDLTEETARGARLAHLVAVYARVTAENRQSILESYRSGKPIDRLPEGFMQREFDTGFEVLASGRPEAKVIEVVEGRRALPTPDPSKARQARGGRPAGAPTNHDLPGRQAPTSD